MARGKRTRVLLDAWVVKGRERLRDSKRRIKVLLKILKGSLVFVEVLSSIALLVTCPVE